MHTSDAAMTSFDQPIGMPLGDWRPPPRPPRTSILGRYCQLEPLDAARHALRLFDANQRDLSGAAWTYLAYGPFDTPEAYRAWIASDCAGDDPLFYAILDRDTDLAVGVASYLRIMPASGSIEVGHINYSPLLQRTRSATEAIYLLMRRAFDIGYRRYEWKCDALNAPSRAAALRLGFTFEGVHRQATVYKGRNRDTAWYAIIDRDWPALRVALERWLDPANFDPQGRQRVRLSDLTAASAQVLAVR
ncbi:MAG TPA: GNAT family protein [Pirellulales bacterium]|jgi:RimJ/RimL family protein N-acetyltransferase|nr:GNAT family protein [Pirellulales bacterium]